MIDPSTSATDRWRIGHLFADHGAESEVLASVGEVVRVTIEPEPNPVVDETIQMDLMAETPDLDLDLAVLHPRCTDASDMTSISGDPKDHANQIPRARELAQEVAEDYVIENKPRDDLRDPTVLTGRMFGLPIAYERAFESSFPIRAPAREQSLGEKTVSPYFYSDRSRDWWAAVKGYTGDYPKGHLAKNALPAVYVQTIVRSWLEAANERDGTVPQDNNTPAPRKVADDQAELPEVVR
ncbi:hypothetical protein [Salinarchaeum laminariae]|uniref:hypothetical protein n=1 Tax=Salinarchaeum laminariae TaxID=869888 RepID=UPI0020C18807|nr:hypothetical protein [Salinarchaeum laminariae]